MRPLRIPAALLVAVALVIGACGSDDDPTVNGNGGSATTTEAPSGTTSTTAGETATLEQPAIWPAPDVVFDEPEAAARDFVEKVLRVPPVISEFRQGDSRSGEIEVYSPGEDGTQRVLRGTLLLRQLGPDSAWFIIGAANANAAISDPETGDEVPAGELTVKGQGRGFEATLVITAFVAGDADGQLDQEITQGGAMETPEPYSVTLDLSAASPGTTVALLVRGDTGLETDPGEFGAIPVVIGEG